MTSPLPSAAPLTSRPLDLLYFIFFLVHIPVSLAIDFQQLYPTEWTPVALQDIARGYLADHGDPIYAGGMGLLKTALHNSIWLTSFTYLELLHFPTFFLGAWALHQGRVAWYPVLIVYGASTATTLVACVSYLLAYPTASTKSATFETMTVDQKIYVLAMMSPWIIIPAVMTIDMTLRVVRTLSAAEQRLASKKTQ